MQKTQITSEMTISDVLSNFPQHSQKLAQTLTNAGLHCTSCSAATWETLENGMLSHGMEREAIDRIVLKLNEIIQEQIDVDTITVTPRAVEKFKEFAKEEGKAGWALRFGDTTGGCSGFEYILDFSEKLESDDTSFESNGLPIHVKKTMVKRLLGAVIDFTDGLYGSGFKISNPNAKSSCGCGKSQGY